MRIKRIVSFTLAFLLTVIQPGLICFAISNEKDKIVISDAEQLQKLAQQCSFDSFSQGLSVELAKDIDLAKSSFSGIPYFCGTFDGCGHTIKHLNLTQEGSDIGFFRYTSEDARITNVIIEGYSEPGGTATIVGGIAGENGGVIRECEFIGDIKASENAGGIAGKNTGVISCCSFSGTVSAEHRAGGISGENTGTIIDCTNKGSINTTLIEVSEKKPELTLNFDVSNLTEDDFLDITDIGGITGLSTTIISGCINEGNVGYERMGYNVGGIAGRQSGRVYNCTNKGSINGRKDVGGIVGQAEPYAFWDISETTLAELKSKLADLQKNLDTLNKGLKNTSPGIKKAAKDLEAYVDTAAKDTNAAIDIVSGNMRQAESAANDLISLAANAIDNNDSAKAKQFIDELADLMKNSPDNIDISSITELLEKLHNYDGDHDLTVSIIADLKKILDYSSTRDHAETDNEERHTKVKHKFKELIADIEIAIDSGDIKLVRELVDELIELIESGADAVDYDDVKHIIDELTDLEDTYIDNADSLCTSVEGIMTSVSFRHTDINKLQADADNIISSAGELRCLISDSSAPIKNDAKSVLDSCVAICDIFTLSDTDVIQLQTEYQTDMSQLDEKKYGSGVVLSCINHGEISAETNVGGIAGTVACEVDIDAEDKLKLPAYMIQNARYVVFSVISDCMSGSDVHAKKECAGGITGNSDFGVVINCESSGSVYGGDHCGGVSGKSLGNISDSCSRCLLYGNKYVGGIVGEGFNIEKCRAYSFVKSEEEYSGSIAGKATGTVEDCVFVENDVGGIDGISYAGKAEPISYGEMIKLPDIPELFKNISVTFVAEGNTVAVIDVDFGGSIDELPEVERKGTLYWKWNDFDDDHIYYSQTVEGEYKAPKTTISTNEEVPLFLAEGNFYDGQELTVVPDTEDISISGEKGTLAGAYKLNVNGADSILKIRMKMPDKGKLYMYSDDKWNSLDYKTDGSYIVFDMKNGGEIAFFKKYHAANIPVWAIITAAVSAAAIIAAVIIIKKNAKKKKAAVPKG